MYDKVKNQLAIKVSMIFFHKVNSVIERNNGRSSDTSSDYPKLSVIYSDY